MSQVVFTIRKISLGVALSGGCLHGGRYVWLSYSSFIQSGDAESAENVLGEMMWWYELLSDI